MYGLPGGLGPTLLVFAYPSLDGPRFESEMPALPDPTCAIPWPFPSCEAPAA